MAVKAESTVPVFTTKSVPLADIVAVNGDNHRIEKLNTEEETKALAASLRVSGLLQPIGVRENGPGGKMRLVWGFRRFAAAKLAKLATVDVRLIPDGVTDEEARAVENDQRLELNPIETGLAVVAILNKERARIAEEDANLPAQVLEGRAQQQVARRLGRSVEYVRTFLYLDRLAKPVVDLVVAGRLPLDAAREIAKLSSAERQREVASRCAHHPDGTGGAPLSEVKRVVERYVARLDDAPWNLAVPLAGEPPCVSCSHNSANMVGLFDGSKQTDGAKAAEAYCTKRDCYGKKNTAARAAVKRAAEKVVHLHVTAKGTAKDKPAPKPPALTAAGVANLTPDAVRPDAVVEVARGLMARSKAGGARARVAEPVRDTLQDRIEEAKLEATQAWDKHAREVAIKVLDKVAKRVAADPMQWILLGCLAETPEYDKSRLRWNTYTVNPRTVEPLRRLYNAVRKCELKLPAVLAASFCSQRHGHRLLSSAGDLRNHPMLSWLHEDFLGSKMEPLPSLEDAIRDAVAKVRESAKAEVKGGSKGGAA